MRTTSGSTSNVIHRGPSSGRHGSLQIGWQTAPVVQGHGHRRSLTSALPPLTDTRQASETYTTRWPVRAAAGNLDHPTFEEI